MTDKNRTDVVVILDRSGSMQSMRKQAESGLNEFIIKMKGASGTVAFTLAQFDDQYEMVYLREAMESVACHRLEPRGMTALHDAVGRTLQRFGSLLAEMPEERRPGKVIVMVITDGLENASREFNRAQVQEMVKTQREKYSWEFLYIGTNQDAHAEGDSLGFASRRSVQYSAGPVGARAMYSAVSNCVRRAVDTGDSRTLDSSLMEEEIKKEEAKASDSGGGARASKTHCSRSGRPASRSPTRERN